MKKYTNTDEGAKVLSPDAHKKAQAALHKQGKTSASELTDEDKNTFSESLRSE